MMINSVSMNSGMSLMSTSGMQRQQQPAGNDAFVVTNSGGVGSVIPTEVKSSAEGAPGVTGTSSDAEEVFDILDINEDGYVSMEELQGLTASQGYNPAEMHNAEDGESGIKPPPPPSPSKVSSAYEANSGDNEISQLSEQLPSRSESEEYSSLKLAF